MPPPMIAVLITLPPRKNPLAGDRGRITDRWGQVFHFVMWMRRLWQIRSRLTPRFDASSGRRWKMEDLTPLFLQAR
jgi:hypothetical protein